MKDVLNFELQRLSLSVMTWCRDLHVACALARDDTCTCSPIARHASGARSYTVASIMWLQPPHARLLDTLSSNRSPASEAGLVI